jgi:tubulin monoglycylase TTLL15
MYDIKIFNINLISISKIYTDNPYYDTNTIFEKILEAAGNSNITEKYKAFILQYDTFKNIKSRMEKLNFDNALHNAKIAYHIAYGKLNLVDIHKKKILDVNKVVSIMSNVKIFISKLIKKKDYIDKKPNSTEEDLDLDLDKELNYTEAEFNEINKYFIKSIQKTEEEEAEKEKLEFMENTGIFEYNCENNCEETNACSLSNDSKEDKNYDIDKESAKDDVDMKSANDDVDMESTKEVQYDIDMSGGNIKENKLLNRYNERIILIKYNIKELIKNNKNNNVEKMQKKIKDIKIKIKNIKEKEKKNKSKQPKPIKEIKDKKLKPVKEIKVKQPKPIKDTKVKQPNPVKDAKIIKQKPVKDTKVKKPKPIKDTKHKKPNPVKDAKIIKQKPVKDTKVKKPKPIKDTKVKKPKPIKETNVKKPKPIKETKVKQPNNLKESKSKSLKPEKESKSKSLKPEKESKSKS